MLQLFYSNRYEALSAALLADLAAQPPDVWRAQPVIVPSVAVRRRLELDMAAAHGICANVEFSYLAQWLWTQMGRVMDVSERSPFAPERLVWRCYRLLGGGEVNAAVNTDANAGTKARSRAGGRVSERADERANGGRVNRKGANARVNEGKAEGRANAWTNEAAAPWLASPRLAAWLDAADEAMRYELAQRIATLFDHYLTYRPEWLIQWQAGGSIFDAGRSASGMTSGAGFDADGTGDADGMGGINTAGSAGSADNANDTFSAFFPSRDAHFTGAHATATSAHSLFTGLTGASAAQREDERWQAALWRALLAEASSGAGDASGTGDAGGAKGTSRTKGTGNPDGQHGPNAQPQKSPPAYRFLDLVRTLDLDAIARAQWPEALSVFALPTMPPLYVALLRELSRWIDVRIYALNPCREFWFDIVSEARIEALAASGRRDYQEVGHPLLAEWGRQTQAQLHMLHELTERAALREASVYVQNDAPTWLARVQNAILDLGSERAAAADNDDADETAPLRPDVAPGIEVHVCHSLARQLEALHDRLLGWFDEDPDLRPADVLVALPNLVAARPLIDAVFGAGAGAAGTTGAARAPDAPVTRRIPYRITGLPPSQANPVARALLDWLALPARRVGAPELIEWLRVDAVAARFGIDAQALETLQAWLAAALARRGLAPTEPAAGLATGLAAGLAGGRASRAPHASNAPSASPIQNASHAPPAQTARHTFADALMRLFLGYALPAGGDPVDAWLPIEGAFGPEAELLGRFASFVDALDAFARASAQPRTPDGWSALLHDALAQCFDAGVDFADALASTRDALDQLVGAMREGAPDSAFSADVVRSALARALDDPARGGVPWGGVTFSSLTSLRGLPYRAICVLGMDDGVLPGAQRADEFDLMAAFGRLGDRQRRDDERNLFLDLLLAARARLLIAYTGRSIRDNAPLPPAALVDELLDHLAQIKTGPDANAAELAQARRAFIVEHPLQPFSADYFRTGDEKRNQGGDGNRNENSGETGGENRDESGGKTGHESSAENRADARKNDGKSDGKNSAESGGINDGISGGINGGISGEKNSNASSDENSAQIGAQSSARNCAQGRPAPPVASPAPPLFTYEPARAELARLLAAPGPRTRAPFFTAPLPPEPAGEDAPVAFDDFQRFWRHPARALLRDRLGVVLTDAQGELRDTEPFEFDYAGRDALARRVLPMLLAQSDEWNRPGAPAGSRIPDIPNMPDASDAPGGPDMPDSARDHAHRAADAARAEPVRAQMRRVAAASPELPGGATGALWRERELAALDAFARRVRGELAQGAARRPFSLRIMPRWPDSSDLSDAPGLPGLSRVAGLSGTPGLSSTSDQPGLPGPSSASGSSGKSALSRDTAAAAAVTPPGQRRDAAATTPIPALFGPHDATLRADATAQPLQLVGTLNQLTPAGQVIFRYGPPGARDYLAAWLAHLVYCAVLPDGPRRTVWHGSNARFEFTPVAHPLDPLALLAALYRAGRRLPLRFFPKSAWAWVCDGPPAAQTRWHSERVRGESDDPALRIALRGTPLTLDEPFGTLARCVFVPLDGHLQKQNGGA